MMWKGTKKVGFGVRGRWVIAWYCNEKGNTGNKANFIKNVGEHCVASNKVNSCFNDLATEQHNAKRAQHEA